jgi:hypothetical protein
MFDTYVASVSSEYCICFTHMLQMLHPDVVYVLQWLHTYFSRVSDICCKCFDCFGRILQMFLLDVVKVDLVLHMLQCYPFAVAGPACMRVVWKRCER